MSKAAKIEEVVDLAEKHQIDDDARRMFEEDSPGYMSWDRLSEETRDEYRAIARGSAE